MSEYLTLAGSPQLYRGKTQARLMRLGSSTTLSFVGREEEEESSSGG